LWGKRGEVGNMEGAVMSHAPRIDLGSLDYIQMTMMTTTTTEMTMTMRPTWMSTHQKGSHHHHHHHFSMPSVHRYTMPSPITSMMQPSFTRLDWVSS